MNVMQLRRDSFPLLVPGRRDNKAAPAYRRRLKQSALIVLSTVNIPQSCILRCVAFFSKAVKRGSPAETTILYLCTAWDYCRCSQQLRTRWILPGLWAQRFYKEPLYRGELYRWLVTWIDLSLSKTPFTWQSHLISKRAGDAVLS